ncbi:MAG: ribulose-phosphate 3-epimerase [Phycisphaerae bacterium]
MRIAPSVLAFDFARLAEQIGAVQAAGATLLHLDIMDGHFVPNLSFGVPVVASIDACTGLFLDTHLMIAEPARYAEPFVKAGADSLTFHIEVAPEPHRVIDTIRTLGARVGVALNPGTPAEAVFEILPRVDLVLVMTVWPGFGGQKFIDECVPKLAALASRLRPDQSLEVDGGVGLATVARCVRAGANTLVAGSALFETGDPARGFAALQAAAVACEQSL